MTCSYFIERYPHGWLIGAPVGARGVPANALSEVGTIFSETAVVDAGIAHHYTLTCPDKKIAFAIPDSVEASTQWRSEIETYTARLEPMARWYAGTDVGMSSAAIFAVLCPIPELALAARDFSRGFTPADGDDFGRCFRLLKLFPEWRARLDEVAKAYPDTAWAQIVARWGELETSDSRRQFRILNECANAAKGAKDK